MTYSGPRRCLISNVPSWVFRGASADLYFSRGTYFSAGHTVSLQSVVSTTRASTAYGQTTSGLLVPFGSNTARVTDQGLLVEEARTNVTLWCCDQTNAAWVKSNVTATLDQTGPDGTANSATSLTATAGNGTVLQSITLASSARFQSAFVKRLTGTGIINMTMDNGSTWTAIVPTSSWQQLSIPTQTLANPTVGFRIVTNGDAIAVAYVQNENGAFKTSPIPTTTVAATRAADLISLTGTAATSALAAKAVFLETLGAQTGNGGASPRLLAFTGTASITLSLTPRFILSDGTNSASATFGSGTQIGLVKGAGGMDSTSMTSICNAGAKVTQGTSTWPTNATGTVYIANRAAGDAALNGYLHRASFSLTKGQFDRLTG